MPQGPNYVGPGVYRHHKNKLYWVLGLSRDSETGRVFVVYRPLYETPDHWDQLVHRPLETVANGTKPCSFNDYVKTDRGWVPRFKYAGTGSGDAR